MIASHRAAGRFDAGLWRLVTLGGAPVGCCLINRNPDLSTVELVYIGLGPEVRGRGLGAMTASLGRASLARRELAGAAQAEFAATRQTAAAAASEARLRQVELAALLRQRA